MATGLLYTIRDRPFYALISRKYAGKTARRSGVDYMNHIREGALILTLLYGFKETLIEAYCVHPLFQNDHALAALLSGDDPDLSQLSLQAVVMAMEYRRVANAYTIKHTVRAVDEIDTGPLTDVHRMLVADKIQNKKDFVKYLYSQHSRPSYRRVADRSLAYFDSWLARLGIDDATYRRVVEQIEVSGINGELDALPYERRA